MLSRSSDKRIGWFRELKEGDQVAVNWGSYGYDRYRIEQVVRITPTGRMKTSFGTQFDSDGIEMGKGSTWTRRKNIVPLDQKVKDHMDKDRIKSMLTLGKWKSLSLEQMRQVEKWIIESEETAD